MVNAFKQNYNFHNNHPFMAKSLNLKGLPTIDLGGIWLCSCTSREIGTSWEDVNWNRKYT